MSILLCYRITRKPNWRTLKDCIPACMTLKKNSPLWKVIYDFSKFGLLCFCKTLKIDSFAAVLRSLSRPFLPEPPFWGNCVLDCATAGKKKLLTQMWEQKGSFYLFHIFRIFRRPKNKTNSLKIIKYRAERASLKWFCGSMDHDTGCQEVSF